MTQLAFIAALLWASLVLSIKWVQPVSRRACNMTYVLWALSLNWTMLVTFVLGSVVSGTLTAPVLLSAFSHNMLPLFLSSNLMTGAVNMSIDSLSVSDGYARLIVSVYITLICLVAHVMYNRDTRLRTFTYKCQSLYSRTK